MLPHVGSRVESMMSQTSPISSHMLTPRWTHAIDVRAESRREDTISLLAMGLSLLAALRDQAVPLAPVPRADLPRRKTPRPMRPIPMKGPTPLNVPQEIEDLPEQQAGSPATSRAAATDY
jgi:hypothetical protein